MKAFFMLSPNPSLVMLKDRGSKGFGNEPMIVMMHVSLQIVARTILINHNLTDIPIYNQNFTSL